MLKTALDKLDHSNDNHWTVDGRPRLETVRYFARNSDILETDIPVSFVRNLNIAIESKKVELSEAISLKRDMDTKIKKLTDKISYLKSKKRSQREENAILTYLRKTSNMVYE